MCIQRIPYSYMELVGWEEELFTLPQSCSRTELNLLRGVQKKTRTVLSFKGFCWGLASASPRVAQHNRFPQALFTLKGSAFKRVQHNHQHQLTLTAEIAARERTIPCNILASNFTPLVSSTPVPTFSCHLRHIIPMHA